MWQFHIMSVIFWVTSDYQQNEWQSEVVFQQKIILQVFSSLQQLSNSANH